MYIISKQEHSIWDSSDNVYNAADYKSKTHGLLNGVGRWFSEDDQHLYFEKVKEFFSILRNSSLKIENTPSGNGEFILCVQNTEE